ncbi:hypothetical protein OEZ86_007543 [Tetradesmus obliquus]|uniref:Uncharacterized protein n=2 Tax=Tetradesmus obliquus TaxID=3088 RepID=A0ABY8U3K3_TETOB|nr:hypothetical protein OEZ85_012761 [Tetradesmus obliquus]WIA36204.1 hypothetical protein OEZ86_007543 [Tetradesmus obliquus]
MSVMQTVYAAAEDAQNGKISEEQLITQLEEAGKQLEDDRQLEVVETVLKSKLDADLAEEAVEAVRRGKGSS